MIHLSIIIPIYNVEKYINKCLDSIFQNNINTDLFEVIIVNDGTPDGSMELVSAYTKLFTNITVINQENKGLGEARNAGAKYVRGKYLWFVDSDDWLVEGAISNILDFINLHNPEILAIDYTYSTGEKSTVKNYAKFGCIYSGTEYLDINYVQNPVQYYIINSSFYFKNSLYFKKGIYHEDSLFTPKALFLANSVMFYNVSCYIYNVREGSIMTSTNTYLKHSSDMITVGADLYHFMKSNARNWSEKRILSKYIGTALGGVYYYWKQLNKKDKTIISRDFPLRLFIKPLFVSFQIQIYPFFIYNKSKMIQAFFVYFILLILMLSLALRGNFIFSDDNLIRKKIYAKVSNISIFLFSLVIGLRYYVGGDYVGYLDDYNDFNLEMSYKDIRYELGYYLLMVILKFFEFAYPFLFIAIAFLQIAFVYKWASNYKYLLPWFVYFYFTTLYLFESMNVMRQAVAFSILLYSTIYIHKSDKIKFVIMVLLATSFHKSAIFFLPFYFFLNKEWIRNKHIQLGLVLLAFVFSQFLFITFFQKIKIIADMLNYESYSELTSDLFLENDKQSMGFGFYFIFAIDSILLFYSDKLKKVFKKENYIVYHNMFFVGALLSAAFGGTNSIALGRFMFYFVSFRIVVLSFLCYYFFRINKNKINKLIGVFVIVAYLIWFISAILKGAAWCSPFQFVFQDFVPNSLYFN